MVKVMGIVIAALLVLSLVIGGAARLLGGEPTIAGDALMRKALLDRIQPLGAVRTSEEDMPEIVTAAVGVPGGEQTGEELVAGVCAACHLAGVGGAPKLDDAADWAARREAGIDALVASVVNGKGTMPAGGGSNYNEDEIRRAVQHMAMFESGAAAPADAPAASEEDTAEAATDATAAAASVVLGEAPADLPAHVKTTVDGVCSGCHLAGVANAPKIGDAEAWGERAALGIDALTATVVSGKGAMPPRGGSSLTDDEIAIAIQYLMSK